MVSKAKSAVRQSDDRALRLSVYIDEVLVSGVNASQSRISGVSLSGFGGFCLILRSWRKTAKDSACVRCLVRSCRFATTPFVGDHVRHIITVLVIAHPFPLLNDQTVASRLRSYWDISGTCGTARSCMGERSTTTKRKFPHFAGLSH
jgi:hypothetical protein